jgi:hypothetical protein
VTYKNLHLESQILHGNSVEQSRKIEEPKELIRIMKRRRPK